MRPCAAPNYHFYQRRCTVAVCTDQALKLYPLRARCNRSCVTKRKKVVYSAHSTACRSPSGTGSSSAIMADALTSVRAIRAADTITYIDHFGGDSEGPVSTAVLASHFIQNFGRRPMKKNLSSHAHTWTECDYCSCFPVEWPVGQAIRMRAQRGRRAPVRLQR